MMIYVVCLTQLLTVAAVVYVARQAKEFLERDRVMEQAVMSDALRHAAEVQESAQQTIRAVVDASDKRVEEILDKAHRDREMLLERIQFPEHLQGSAIAAGVTPSPSTTIDEKKQWELDHPDEPWPEIDDDVPQAQGVVTPLKPVTPFTGGPS